MAVEDTVCVNIFVKVIFLSFVFHIHVSCRCKESLICCCCCDGTCIHKCNGCDLSALKLRAFTVREVSGWVTDGERIIGRCISGTEARSAECCLHDRSRFHKVSNCTVLYKFHVNRCTCRIYAECKFIRTNVMSFDNVCCSTDIFKSTTGTSCDDSLIHI